MVSGLTAEPMLLTATLYWLTDVKIGCLQGRHRAVHNKHGLFLHRAYVLARCELLLRDCVFGHSNHMSVGEGVLSTPFETVSQPSALLILGWITFCCGGLSCTLYDV